MKFQVQFLNEANYVFNKETNEYDIKLLNLDNAYVSRCDELRLCTIEEVRDKVNRIVKSDFMVGDEIREEEYNSIIDANVTDVCETDKELKLAYRVSYKYTRYDERNKEFVTRKIVWEIYVLNVVIPDTKGISDVWE